MNLPNYFLADLPADAILSRTTITEACQTLKKNRERFLADRSTASLIEVLAAAAQNWLQPEYPLRQHVLEHGPALGGFSPGTLRQGLDNFFGQLTVENLEALMVQELGHAQRMDGFVAGREEQFTQRASQARGPELLAHIAAGNVPNPALLSMVLGLLVRSAQFVKCASGTALIPRLFAHSLYELEPKLGACLEVAEWRGGDGGLESALFSEADCVTATGSDETLAAIRVQLQAGTRFLGYGHRVSFGYVTHKVLAGPAGRRVLADAVQAITAWNQLGCLSPHVFYVEHGGSGGGGQFAERLAVELAKREEIEPRGPIPIEVAATIASRRAFYEVRAAHAPENTRHWFSPQSTAWTVIYENDPRFQVSCLHRFIYVKAVADLTEALRNAGAFQGQISTVGLAAAGDQVRALARQLARWGVTRVCPLGQMQNPPLAWRHDGRPALADLITWTDWELESRWAIASQTPRETEG